VIPAAAVAQLKAACDRAYDNNLPLVQQRRL